MTSRILKLARQKFNLFSKKYKGFVNVLIDDWRGFRFIFDTKDVRCCRNNCSKCPLFLLVEKESSKIFSSGLYPASQKDKKFFGRQNYLNCKTLKQYQNCYLNFIIKKTKSRKQILDELRLVKNLRFIYSSQGNLLRKESKFKEDIFQYLLLKTKGRKRNIINEFVSLHFCKNQIK